MEINENIENNSITNNEALQYNMSPKVRRAQSSRGEIRITITINTNPSNTETQNQNNQNKETQNQKSQNQNNQNQKSQNQNNQNQKSQNQDNQNQDNQNQKSQNQNNQNQKSQNQNNQNQKSQNQDNQNQKSQNQKSQNQKSQNQNQKNSDTNLTSSSSETKSNNQNQSSNNKGKPKNSKGNRNESIQNAVSVNTEKQYDSNSESISDEIINSYYNSIPQEEIQNVDNQETIGDMSITRDNVSNNNNNNNNNNYATIGNKNDKNIPSATGVLVILGIYAFFMLSVGFYIHRKKSNSKKMKAKEEEALDIMDTYKYVNEDDYPYPIINKHLKNVICTTYEAPSCPPPIDTYKNISDLSIHIKSPLGDPNNVITGESDTSVISSLNEQSNVITFGQDISVPEKAAISNVESNLQ